MAISNCPRHVAIIMDGNGRWATERSHTRVWGHVRGARVVSQIVKEALNLGIESLTLFTFSTENWCRPLGEIQVLFKLFKKFLELERHKMIDGQVRLRVIGDYSHLPLETRQLIEEMQEEGQDFQRLNLTLAFGYGGRKEIVEAVNKFIDKNPGRPIDEDLLNNYLFVPELGDVDLMLRTGGDQRISNFLLWQSSYAELFFTATKWPDFTPREFGAIVKLVAQRERRFGQVSPQQSLNFARSVAFQQQNLLLNSLRV